MIMPVGFEHLTHSIEHMKQELRDAEKHAHKEIENLKHDSELEFSDILTEQVGVYNASLIKEAVNEN